MTSVHPPRTFPSLLVYGAYGFTGRLILEGLTRRGIGFVVAGRNAQRVAEVAGAFRAPQRVFALDNRHDIDAALFEVGIVLNAAGPFRFSTGPLLSSCLRNRVHYLDVGGEVGPLEDASRLDTLARARNVMILPGIGFDVVPSDCLAVHLARRLPDAEALVISICGSNLLSRGSALTFAEHAGIPVYTRRGGALEPMRLRSQLRWVDFGDGTRATLAVSWGDLVTAFWSTRIQDIEVYFEATAPRCLGVIGNQYFGWLSGSPWAKSWLKEYAKTMPEGPCEAERQRERVVLVGEIVGRGRRVRSRLTTPEAYSFTGSAAAAVVERVLGGAVAPGFQTPAALLGPDFVLSLQGVHREDCS